MQQLASAVEYLHSKQIVHRDLKPENCGFAIDGTLKVFDFDVARYLPTTTHGNNPGRADNDDGTVFLMSAKVGSPRYMAPEVARGVPYNHKVDVYAFGLMFHEVLTLEKPYEFISSEEHDQQVVHRHARPAIPSWLPVSTRRLIAACWSPTIGRRPDMTTVRAVLKRGVSNIVHAYATGTTKLGWNRRRGHAFTRGPVGRRDVVHPVVSSTTRIEVIATA
jgi:serine/threonine protein kinase